MTVSMHPLGYLLGLEGVALLRAFAGEFDGEFTLQRIAEIRALLDRGDELGGGVEVPVLDAGDAYAGWAAAYDNADNALVRTEQPHVRAILDSLEVGTALDAACGTARHGRHLAALGHRVIGVDSSPEMLAQARGHLPDAEFREGRLQALPVADDGVDLVVCGLALMHVAELAPVFAEFARVLRPGGDLVISDWRGMVGESAAPFVMTGPDGEAGWVKTTARATSDYLTAALELGLELRSCAEPYGPDPLVDDHGVGTGDGRAPAHVAGDVPNRWALHPYAPSATNAANHRRRHALILHFKSPREPRRA